MALHSFVSDRKCAAEAMSHPGFNWPASASSLYWLGLTLVFPQQGPLYQTAIRPSIGKWLLCLWMRLTQSGVVITVLSVWPAVVLVTVVTAHCFQLDLFGQGRQIWEGQTQSKTDIKNEEERKGEKKGGINKRQINGPGGGLEQWVGRRLSWEDRGRPFILTAPLHWPFSLPANQQW